jgi:hypothetical protein
MFWLIVFVVLAVGIYGRTKVRSGPAGLRRSAPVRDSRG